MADAKELVGTLNDIAGTNGLEAAGAANAALLRVQNMENRLTDLEGGGGGGGLTQVQADLLYAPILHIADTSVVHGIADTTALVLTDDTRLSNARTPTSHSHPISEVTNLQTTLDGKSATSHNHDAAYAAIAHNHAQLHDRQHSVTSASDHTFPGGTTTFLRADGTFAAPAGGGEAFPVGSVFISVVSTNPATLLGYGTWSAFGAGRTLVGIDAGQTEFDTVEETGGAKTHTLQTTEMPAHTHTQSVNSAATGGLSGYTADTSTNTSVTSGYSTGSTGGGGAHNNLQPFIVCYFWKRTA